MTRVKRSTMRTNRARYGSGGGFTGIRADEIRPLFVAVLMLLVGFLVCHLIGSGQETSTLNSGESSYHLFLKRSGNVDTGDGKVSDSFRHGDDGVGDSEGEGKPYNVYLDLPGGNDKSEPESDALIDGNRRQSKKVFTGEEEIDLASPEEGVQGEFVQDVVVRKFSQKVQMGPTYTFDKHVMFHNYVKRKSGAVVEDMLMAHAYIFHQNATYGGCCGEPGLKMTAHEELLDALGLKGVLLFKCPRDYAGDAETRRSVIPRERYQSDDTRVWTPEYVEYIRSMATYPRKRFKEYTIVVHMQRGDTSPCRMQNHGFYRYLPNMHYQTLIEKYMKPGARVIIYSSAKSFEPLDEFRQRGYQVNTDASLKDTWKDFVTSDVFIMSRSDFSMVPAMVAKGTVVYTPFWHHPLRRWKRVDNDTMMQTDGEISRLREEKCS